jgi:hypothetical protein
MTKFILSALAALGCAACYKDYPTDAVEQRLELRVEADSLPADGATLVHVVAAIPVNARPDSRTVSFTTNSSAFVDGGQATAAVTAIKGVADTYLRAPRTPGPIRIRAQLGTVIRDTTIQFHTAHPARADLQPSAFVTKGSLGSQITVTAHLRRGVGLTTPGVEIRFEALREDNKQPIGRFGVAPPSNSEATVTVTYSAGDTPYVGPVRIRALTLTGQVLGETTINVAA